MRSSTSWINLESVVRRGVTIAAGAAKADKGNDRYSFMCIRMAKNCSVVHPSLPERRPDPRRANGTLYHWSGLERADGTLYHRSRLEMVTPFVTQVRGVGDAWRTEPDCEGSHDQ